VVQYTTGKKCTGSCLTACHTSLSLSSRSTLPVSTLSLHERIYPGARRRKYLETSMEDLQEDIKVSTKLSTQPERGTTGYMQGATLRGCANCATSAYQDEAPNVERGLLHKHNVSSPFVRFSSNTVGTFPES
jgi:hypothetical protein